MCVQIQRGRGGGLEGKKGEVREGMKVMEEGKLARERSSNPFPLHKVQCVSGLGGKKSNNGQLTIRRPKVSVCSL